jgi:orotidine 5'-phosphate decarboxylase subfamily 1
MERKRSNLCVAVDVTENVELLRVANLVGPNICMLKTHADVVRDYDFEALRAIAAKHDFLLFEDRKLADVPHVVLLQHATWADVVSVHIVSGEASVKALSNIGKGAFLVAEMSTYTDGGTTQKEALRIGLENGEYVSGFICQGRFSDGDGFVYCAAGVSADKKFDGLGQVYTHPQELIVDRGIDVIIVGRSITHAKDVVDAARYYKEMGWLAYLKRCKDLLN